MAGEDRGKTLIYLDNAATSYPKPPEVLAFMSEWYAEYGVNPGRSGTDLAQEAEGLVRSTRERLAGFFGASGDPDRLVFTSNASSALNTAIQGVLKAGDHVVATTLDHNSVTRPIYHLTKYDGMTSDLVAFGDDGTVDPDAVRAAIRPETKAVVMSHGSNTLGTIQRVAEVGAICRELGVTFILDVAQTAGAIPIAFDAWQIDVLCFTGHKSLMGPTGIGGMYVREGVEVAPLLYGGTGVRSEYPDHLEAYPWRLECGTLNLLGVAGLSAGLTWIENRSLADIEAHEARLTRQLIDGLRDVPGVTVYCAGSADRRLPVVSANIDGMTANNVGTLLDVKFGIATRTGLQCAPYVHRQLGTVERKGTVRFSMGPFNTEADIQAVLDGMRDISERHGKV